MQKLRNKPETYIELTRPQTINVKPDVESETEVITSSLQSLHLKLQELESERNAALEFIDRLSRNGENILKSLATNTPSSSKEITSVASLEKRTDSEEIISIKQHCNCVHEQLIKIIELAKEPSVSLRTTRLPTCDSKVDQRSTLPKKHFKPDYRILPFVPSGSGSTFSLPATIQNLLANLKTQHNKLCSVSEIGASIDDALLYLEQLTEIIKNCSQYLHFSSDDLSSSNKVLPHVVMLEQLTEKILQLHGKVLQMKRKIKSIPPFDTQAACGTKAKPQVSVPKKCKNPKNQQPPKAQNKTKTANVHPFHTQRPRQTKKQPNSKIIHNNSEILRYVKLLQVSLRRNGYKLKMTED